MSGGGSGGHITPLLATAVELKRLAPEAKLVFIGQKSDRFGQLAAEHPAVDEAYFVSAGKFRRYYGEGVKQLLNLKTLALNTRDFFRFLVGLAESYRLLGRLAPDVVFIKGGFVGVPIGLAAAQRKIPYVTHDSDAIPGLANRLISRWANYHAVALPASEYKNYPASKTITTGIPLLADFKPASATEQKKARAELNLTEFEQVVLVTGGGLGAQRLNDYVLALAPNLLNKYRRLALIHIAGAKQENAVSAGYKQALTSADLARVKVLGFTSKMAKYAIVSDVIITRAGATTIAEFAALAKPCIVVPNPNLTGGHQLKNAEVLEKNGATLMVTEGKTASDELFAALEELLASADGRNKLAANLTKLARPDAANKLASLLLEVAEQSTDNTKISRQINNGKTNR